jgi:hypothetical protein
MLSISSRRLEHSEGRLFRGFASAAEAHFGIQAKEKTEHRLGAVRYSKSPAPVGRALEVIRRLRAL